MRTVSKFLTGFTLGALLGAALALLFAPSSGDELRGRMLSEAERVQFEVKKAAEDRRVELEQQLAALRAPR